MVLSWECLTHNIVQNALSRQWGAGPPSSSIRELHHNQSFFLTSEVAGYAEMILDGNYRLDKRVMLE